MTQVQTLIEKTNRWYHHRYYTDDTRVFQHNPGMKRKLWKEEGSLPLFWIVMKKCGSRKCSSDENWVGCHNKDAKSVHLLRPVYSRLTRSLNFNIHRGETQTQKYGGLFSGKIDRWAVPVDAQMKSVSFKPSDFFSLLSFLQKLQGNLWQQCYSWRCSHVDSSANHERLSSRSPNTYSQYYVGNYHWKRGKAEGILSSIQLYPWYLHQWLGHRLHQGRNN